MSSRPSDYPTLLPVPASRLWAFLWTALFFVLINIVIWNIFQKEEAFERFHYHTSYEEVRAVIETIRQDPRQKIVFVGGSVMWGVGTRDASDTVPAAFDQLLQNNEIAVYNLGIIGARPIDQFLLMYLLKDEVDLFISDFNYEFGLPIESAHLLQDPGASVRLSQLFASEGPSFISAIPGIDTCMAEAGLSVPRAAPTVEISLRTWMEHAIPVLRYKDRINDRLFGQHPLLLIERALLQTSKALRNRDFTLDAMMSLVLPPEERIETGPWQPDGPVGSEAIKTQAFDPDNLHMCVSRAWSVYVAGHALPVVTYLTPNNPDMFPDLHGSSLYRNNIEILARAFSGSTFLNLDDASLQPSSFTDSTHLTPGGALAFAEILLDRLRPILADYAL